MPTYDPGWHDMSDYVVHFTREYGGRGAYDNIPRILGEGTLLSTIVSQLAEKAEAIRPTETRREALRNRCRPPMRFIVMRVTF